MVVGESFDAAARNFHSRYKREGSLCPGDRVLKARRSDWKPEDWRDTLLNCQEDGNGYTVCTTLAGEDAGQFRIPPGETPYGIWIVDELIKCKKSRQEPKQLRLLDPMGNIFCTQKMGDEYVAIKAARECKEAIHDQGVGQKALREVAVLKKLSHKNIVRLLDVFCSPQEVVLVLELLEVSLKQYIGQRRYENTNVSPQLVKHFMRQLTVGVEYVHSKGIVHRDLTPSHFLVDQDNNLKICSFGSARSIGLGQELHDYEFAPCRYTPPEIFLGSKMHGRPGDVWSCGCVLGEMASGTPLFQGDYGITILFQIFRKLGTPTEAQWPGLHELPDFKASFPKWQHRPWSEIRNLRSQLGPDGLKLIDTLLRYNPMVRPTARAALQLDYLSGS